MVRRLARFSRQKAPQSLHHPQGRPQPPAAPAEGSRPKKTLGLGTVRQICEAYAECWPGKNHNRYVAEEAALHFGGIRPHQVTPLQLVTLIEAWKRRFTRNTLYWRRHALKRLLRHIEHVADVPGLASELPRVAYPRPRETVATADDLRKLYAHAEPWLRCWLTVSIGTALRQREVRRLAPLHYDVENRLITIESKGGRTHTLPVNDEVAAALENAPHDDDPTVSYIARYRGRSSSGASRRVTEQSIGWWWRRLKRDAGVNPNLWPHDLRRTAAELLYTATRDIRVVQQLLGHESLASTTSYLAHKDPAALRPLMAQLRIPTEVKQ